MKSWAQVAEIQPLASKIISNSIRKNRVSHAYLIQGARGTGKKSIALLLAKRLLCQNVKGIDPCNECRACKRIILGNHPDVHWIQPDGQSIKIEQIRELQKEFTYSGLESNHKVYVIEGSDTLTLNAANRILKFLEEPNAKTTAIMLTENSQLIIPTIRSRCQIVDLQPLQPLFFQKKLIESGMSDKNAILMSALTNNIEEAFIWSEDEWFAKARKLVLQLVYMYSTSASDVYLFIHQHWMLHFKEREEQEIGLDLLLLTFKDILYYYIGNKQAMVVFAPDEKKLEKVLVYFSEERLLSALQALLKAKRKLKQNVNPTLVMEQLTLHI